MGVCTVLKAVMRTSRVSPQSWGGNLFLNANLNINIFNDLFGCSTRDLCGHVQDLICCMWDL